MPKIVIVTSWPTDVIGGSGTAVFFNSFLHGLRERGRDLHYEIDVIAPRLDITDYVDVTLRRFLFNTELRTDPRVLSADLVIGFDYDGYGLDRRYSPPLLTSAHAVYGDIVQWESGPVQTMVHSQAFFDRVAMEKAAHVTIGSQYAKDRIVALYGIAPEKITVIPHGIENPTWLSYVAAEESPKPDHPILLSVGKMYPRKRTALLLYAVSLLRHKHPSVELRLVGDGLEWEHLHALADGLNLHTNVTFLGSISDDRAFAREWRQADIFVHPSNQETFGFVYLEAMLCGKAIVAAEAGAAPEVLGEAALLVEPDNPQALADALDRFLSDPFLRQDYQRRTRLQANQFSQAKMIDGYIEVIELILAQPKRERHPWTVTGAAD